MLVSHADDGSIQTGAVPADALQDDSVSDRKLSAAGGTDGQVLTKDLGVTGGIKWATPAGSSSDHGDLTGLADDDHLQYLTATRGDARYYTQAQIDTALGGKEDSIAAGTTSQYWRGDKSWQTLDKTTVGLANVDNTSDANKPISSATQTELDGKAGTSHIHDDRYFTESEVSTALSGKSDTSHTHSLLVAPAGITQTAESQVPFTITQVAGADENDANLLEIKNSVGDITYFSVSGDGTISAPNVGIKITGVLDIDEDPPGGTLTGAIFLRRTS